MAGRFGGSFTNSGAAKFDHASSNFGATEVRIGI
jgi:hypothetical protein